jgi:hypothetical protein
VVPGGATPCPPSGSSFGCTVELDVGPCASAEFRGSELYYVRDSKLWKVSLDAFRGAVAPPALVKDLGHTRTLFITGQDMVAYSTDPADRYVYGAGDGWFGSWRFMERGLQAQLSRDGTRMYWLEHAAQTGGVGDLYVAPVDGATTSLARNTADYTELSDGRLLAASNAAFRGTQNRIVVIDQAAREVRWVADSASRYQFIPDSDDLLVDIVTGASTADLYRVPLPKKR